MSGRSFVARVAGALTTGCLSFFGAAQPAGASFPEEEYAAFECHPSNYRVCSEVVVDTWQENPRRISVTAIAYHYPGTAPVLLDYTVLWTGNASNPDAFVTIQSTDTNCGNTTTCVLYDSDISLPYSGDYSVCTGSGLPPGPDDFPFRYDEENWATVCVDIHVK